MAPHIQHLIVLMLENRSFDHMLGYLEYPPKVKFEGVRGREAEMANRTRDGRAITPGQEAEFSIFPGPEHSHEAVMEQLLESYPRAQPYTVTSRGYAANYETITPGKGKTALQCFMPKRVPVLTTLAQEFAVCDHWFCSVPGATWPNRNFTHAGTSDGEVNIKPRLYGNRTVFEELSSAERDWAVYYSGFPPQALIFPRLWSPVDLGWLQRFKPIHKLYRAIQHDRLPHYAFVEPDTVGKTSDSQHPGMGGEIDFRAAERLIWRIYNTLRENMEVFNKTLLLITYDEHGGFFDHVPPPQGPEWSVAEIYQEPDSGYEFKFDLLGPRVPTVLVSPWIAPGTVDHTVYDHTSIPATVLKIFGDELSSEKALGERVARANTFDGVLNLDSPRESLPQIKEPVVDERGRKLVEEEVELRESMISILRDLIWEQITKQSAGQLYRLRSRMGHPATRGVGDADILIEIDRQIRDEIVPELSPKAQQVVAQAEQPPPFESETPGPVSRGLPEFFQLGINGIVKRIRYYLEKLLEDRTLVDDAAGYVERILRKYFEESKTIFRTADGLSLEQPGRSTMEREINSLFDRKLPGTRCWLADREDRWLTLYPNRQANFYDPASDRNYELENVDSAAALRLFSLLQQGEVGALKSEMKSATPVPDSKEEHPQEYFENRKTTEEAAMSTQSKGSSNLYALLIGVDFYFPNTLPNGIYYPHLGGCVRDISHVEDFLKRKLGMQKDHIFKLTASNKGGAKPPEPPEQWPTYENMVEKFNQLASIAQAGDRVYIHYAGHGGRATTAFSQLKGDTGLDETLVPTDIGNSEARYLRDVELAHLIKTMVDKGLIVTVVLDSCHSAGATRGQGGAVPRGVGRTDTAQRPTDSLAGSPAELAETWRSISAGGTRNVKAGSGWLLEPQGYTLLAACRASESAFEYPFDGKVSNGALTYWLLDSLKQIGPGLTYKMVHDRVLAKVHSQFERQTPQLQGEGDREVFGSERGQPQYAVPVLQVDQAQNRVLLNAGQAQGLRKGAKFAVYPPSTLDFTAVDQRLALVEIADVGASESWAVVTKQLRQDKIQLGAQAVLLDPGVSRLRRSVRLVQQELQASIDQKKALGQVEAAIAQNEGGFISLAGEGEPADFQVAVSKDGNYELWDSAGNEILNLRPPLSIEDSLAPTRVVQRLIHLTKYRNVKELDNHDAMSPLARKLVVELVGKQKDYTPGDPPEPQPFTDPGGTPTLEDGDWIFLRIRNALPPGAPDDPQRILNVTVLDLQPDWGISQIYPAGAGLFEPLDPGQEIVLPLTANLPSRYKEGTDTIKVFATTETTNFRWLELPSLDQPIRRSAEMTARRPADSLEELLASVAAQAPKTRNLEVAAYPSRGWVTAQVEVQIEKENDLD